MFKKKLNMGEKKTRLELETIDLIKTHKDSESPTQN